MDKIKLYTTDNRVIHKSKDENINDKLTSIIGPHFGEYRKKWDLVNKLNLVTDFPMFLHIDLQQHCNYKCPHCNIHNQDLLLKQFDGQINVEMDFEKYKSIVDEGAEHNCPSIEPQGTNEPLLIKDFHKYIKYAFDKNYIDIMINSNGSPLTKRRSQELLDSGLTRLRFSLDAATPETYKKVRVGSIPLERVIKNIENFLELKEKGGYKLPVTGVSMCVLRQNQHEREMFEKFWINKVDMVTFQAFYPPNYEEDFTNFFPDDLSIKEKFSEKTETFRCPQPFQRVVIRNDNITACCNTYSNQLTLGKLKDGIYNAWNGKLANYLRDIHKCGKYYLNATCKKCVENTSSSH
jgi:MoaA/NifB/PqqE/SkfB family radical SAM enzyme